MAPSATYRLEESGDLGLAASAGVAAVGVGGAAGVAGAGALWYRALALDSTTQSHAIHSRIYTLHTKKKQRHRHCIHKHKHDIRPKLTALWPAKYPGWP